ncbi:MAG: bifunctional phosphoglucose/phosphomannose isomerase [Candidatus Omnitrophota bacterium]
MNCSPEGRSRRSFLIWRSSWDNMRDLDSTATIERFDRSDMKSLLDSFSDQILEAKDIGHSCSIPRVYASGSSGIVFAGLGGSAIGADLIRSYLNEQSRIPIFVNRHYTLPGFVSSKTLVIVSSYSGNTEETLSAFRQAVKKKARIIAVTSGGILADLAKKFKVPFVTIPGGLPPRCALAYSFFPALVLLEKLKVCGKQGRFVDETADLLRVLRNKKVGSAVPASRNIAKKIAMLLFGKFPVFYSGQDHFDAVATRWRGQLSENSKALSSSHVLPEMNHNEIVGWENPPRLLGKWTAVFLRDSGDHPRIKKRFEVSARILKDSGAATIELTSVGSSLLPRIFSLVHIGDYTSFYLALLYGQDPTPVARIDYLKRELGKGSRQ